MEDQLRDIYNRMAEHLSSMIPTEWDKVYLLGEVEKGQLSLSATFYFIETETKDIVRGIDIPDIYDISEKTYEKLQSGLRELVLELNNCFKDDGQELWEQVIFILDSDGSFDIDFKYDVMTSGDGGASRRIVIWAYDTFGYKPKEGTYFREELDEYLRSRER